MCIDPLQDEERTYRINDHRIARMQNDDYKKYFNELVKQAQPHINKQIATIEPEQEKWFKANGIPYQLQ